MADNRQVGNPMDLLCVCGHRFGDHYGLVECGRCESCTGFALATSAVVIPPEETQVITPVYDHVSSLPVDVYNLHCDSARSRTFVLRRVRKFPPPMSDGSIIDYWLIMCGPVYVYHRFQYTWVRLFEIPSAGVQTVCGFDTPESAYEVWKINKERLVEREGRSLDVRPGDVVD
jgi:hypothetical protein